jgi:hypothetical protein
MTSRDDQGAGVDAPAHDETETPVTTHDEDDQHAAAAAPSSPPALEVVVTVDEAHEVLAALPEAVCRDNAVAELLRRIITAGRKTGMAFITDETEAGRMRRFRQYPSLAAMEAALADPAAAAAVHVVTSARPPLVSDATIAEATAMAERDQAAGGPPWEIADHPENAQPGGWHHGQLGGVQ